MARLEFAKYEGLGNDFIVVDVSSPAEVGSDLAARLCDRHFGIGADGMLLVSPARSGGARASMTVLNADGSRPEMCGNGIRCVALHLARRADEGGVSLVVDTDAGPMLCEVERDGGIGSVSTSLGQGLPVGKYPFQFEGTAYELTRVSMGNPHAVLFDAGLDAAAIDRMGPAVSSALPGGSNVEFAGRRGPREYDLVVWERGVGRTLACGTGAAATVVAAALSGLSPFGEPVSVRLPGGVLEISVSRASLEVRQRGPARLVFAGAVG